MGILKKARHWWQIQKNKKNSSINAAKSTSMPENDSPVVEEVYESIEFDEPIPPVPENLPRRDPPGDDGTQVCRR